MQFNLDFALAHISLSDVARLQFDVKLCRTAMLDQSKHLYRHEGRCNQADRCIPGRTWTL